MPRTGILCPMDEEVAHLARLFSAHRSTVRAGVRMHQGRWQGVDCAVLKCVMLLRLRWPESRRRCKCLPMVQ